MNNFTFAFHTISDESIFARTLERSGGVEAIGVDRTVVTSARTFVDVDTVTIVVNKSWFRN